METALGKNERVNLEEDKQLYHHLRNGFNSVIRRIIENDDNLSIEEIKTAIKNFLIRSKSSSNPLVIQARKEFKNLLTINDLDKLKKEVEETYCRFDEEGCQNLRNPSPQQSLI